MSRRTSPCSSTSPPARSASPARTPSSPSCEREYGRLCVPARIGRGRDAFEAAADALLSWGMHRAMPGVRITAAPPASPGASAPESLAVGS
ncbi:DUF1990 family protein [Streptomyces blastmyceticus]|uniref:DUF1990 family protein n=1 Tax=Streptomyces blastmyceticus TaxID=68180 RepID=UPI0031D0A1FB